MRYMVLLACDERLGTTDAQIAWLRGQVARLHDDAPGVVVLLCDETSADTTAYAKLINLGARAFLYRSDGVRVDGSAAPRRWSGEDAYSAMVADLRKARQAGWEVYVQTLELLAAREALMSLKRDVADLPGNPELFDPITGRGVDMNGSWS